MRIENTGSFGLDEYIYHQLRSFFPSSDDEIFRAIKTFFPASLKRYFRCANEIQTWEPNCLNVLHSASYCIFLYYLANLIWKETGDERSATLLFLLNKALSGADIFYEIDMPDVFCLGHSSGIVLAKAKYNNYLVLHQGVTVGKSQGECPVLGEGVILYPNSTVIGDCHVGSRSIITPGVHVLNQDIPKNSIVFSNGGSLLIKSQKIDYLADIFR